MYIVGAAKCGTTSLHHYLAQHPDIFMSEHKEPHFFANFDPDPSMRHMIRRIADEEQYLSLFDKAQGARIIGEASPSYLWDRMAAKRIHVKRPDAKIVIVLRDPVARAYSHYLMDVREGIQTRPFLEALEHDLTIKDQFWGSSKGHMYVELGMYAEQINAYLQTYDRSQIFIGMFDDLKNDPRAFTARILDFLDVSQEGMDCIDFSEEHNAYAAPRGVLSRLLMSQSWLRSLAQTLFPLSLRRWVKAHFILKQSEKPEMDEAAIELLRKIYTPELEALESALGQNFPSLWGDRRSG